MVDPEERLTQAGIQLPTPVGSRAKYRPVTRVGRLLYVSGQGPFGGENSCGLGVVGDSLTLAEGREAARLAALNMLAALKSELGTLSELTRVVKLRVFVRCSSGFGLEHLVADGASELLEEVVGPDGLGARSAIGVADLPFGICVEVEGIVEVRAS